MNVIKPPSAISKVNPKKRVRIFLAGSIEMGKAEDWQSRITNNLKKLNTWQDIVVFNPRRDDWDSSWEQKFENPQFSQQVNWELNALEHSDIIVMYFSPETKSPISLLELGLFARSGKLLVCCPDGFWRKGNVDIVCEKYSIPNFDSLEDLLTFMEESLR
jgi:hypothetical protein